MPKPHTARPYVLVIDNYDSFTYNLVHLVGRHTDRLEVVRNDQITIEDIRERNPDFILISPGPGRPEDAGVSEQIIREFGATTPILGVCLGHQAIGQVFGGTVTHAPTLMHGKTSTVQHNDEGLFADVPQDFVATRYHSLVVDPGSFPEVLEVTARSADGVIQGLRHRTLPIQGVQFHPESVLCVEGPKLIENWLAGRT
ncbi:MAG: aminodeoxychorismate/anthranilate synthase component II [Bacteroidota bacterium]